MPDKKVIDILPPEELAVDLGKDKMREAVQAKEALSRETGRNKKSLIYFLFFLILAGAFFYFTLSKAEIDIWPATEVLQLETKLTISKEIKESDISAKVIPAQIFQKEKTLVEVFPSSGKVLKEERARGVIKVYNDYSTAPQVLIANTRFVSADGKLFRTPVRVVIPGRRREEGRLIPGEIEVGVVADRPGPEYNINPSKFSIPGFAGTAKFTKFYGQSFNAMTGGFREEKAVVTKNDLLKAEDFLTKQVEKECQELLKSGLQAEAISSKFYYFTDESKGEEDKSSSLPVANAWVTEIIENFSLAVAGQEIGEFKFQVKARCQTLLFSKEDLRNFVKESIIRQVPQGYKLYEESLKINHSLQSINLDTRALATGEEEDLFSSPTGTAILSLNISAKIYSQIDEHSLKSALSGKSSLETKLFLGNQPNITKVNVEFWPFWVNRVPEDFNKIKININID